MGTLLGALDYDWKLLVRSGKARQALRLWSEDPVLGNLTRLDEVLEWTKQGTDPADSDRVLAALARRASVDADEVAARTLLQCLAPGLCRLAGKYGARDPDVVSEVIAAAYERIRTYPIDRRPRAIAANVIADTHQKLWRARQKKQVETCALEECATAAAPVEETATQELVQLVAEAVKAGRLTREAAEVIVLTRVYDVDIASLAEAEGLDPQTMRQRRRRAEARLVAEVA